MPGSDRRLTWTIVESAGIILLLTLFIWASREVLNPAVLFVVIFLALRPFQGRPGHGLLVGLTAVVAAVWVLSTTGSLLAPFILAAGLAYLMDPLADRIEARGPSRTVAVLLLAVPVVGAVVAAGIFGLPALWSQLEGLLSRAPVLLERAGEWLSDLEGRLATVPWMREVLQPLADIDQEAVATFLQERREMLIQQAWGGMMGLGRGLGAVLGIVGYVVLTPVLVFYLLRDWDRFTGRLVDLLPRDRRDEVLAFARDYDGLLARYVRGQFLVASISGTVTALGLWVLGIPYALLIGVSVAVFGFVPYLGLVMSLIPAVLVAVTSGAPGIALLKVAAVFAFVQGLEGTVVSPRVVGESVGLHPVWVLLALAAGGYYFGFVGLLLGVPAAVGIKLLLGRGLERWRASDLYRGTDEPEPA